MARDRWPAASVVHQPDAGSLSLPGESLQQQRRMERERDRARVLHRASPLPDGLVPRSLRGADRRPRLERHSTAHAATAARGTAAPGCDRGDTRDGVLGPPGWFTRPGEPTMAGLLRIVEEHRGGR